jgi:hypothetical protein
MSAKVPGVPASPLFQALPGFVWVGRRTIDYEAGLADVNREIVAGVVAQGSPLPPCARLDARNSEGTSRPIGVGRRPR